MNLSSKASSPDSWHAFPSSPCSRCTIPHRVVAPHAVAAVPAGYSHVDL